jgi:hypothetical protein
VTPGPDAAGQALPTLGGYRNGFTIFISDKALRFLPPACLVLIFFLTIFTSWVGIYPGGLPAITQSAWGAAFGGYSEPGGKDMQKIIKFPTREQLADMNEDKEAKDRVQDPHPGWSPLLILYLLLFLLALLLSIAITVLPFLNLQLPPQVQQFLPWQWAALAGLNAVLLLFLGLQMLLGFSLENNFEAYVRSRPEYKKEAKSDFEQKRMDVDRGGRIAYVQRTIWLRLAFFLQLVAAVAAGLVFWIDKRGPSMPLPCIDVKW